MLISRYLHEDSQALDKALESVCEPINFLIAFLSIRRATDAKLTR